MICEAAVPFIGRDHVGSFLANGTLQYQSLRVPAKKVRISTKWVTPAMKARARGSAVSPGLDVRPSPICRSRQRSPPTLQGRNLPQTAPRKSTATPHVYSWSKWNSRHRNRTSFPSMFGTASSMPSLFPAQNSYTMSISQKVAPPRPKSSAEEGHCKVSRKGLKRNKQASRVRPFFNIIWRDDDVWPASPSRSPKCSRARKPGQNSYRRINPSSSRQSSTGHNKRVWSGAPLAVGP